MLRFSLCSVFCEHFSSQYSSLAQLAEHLTVNQVVAGSSPAGGAKNHITLYAPLAQLVEQLTLNQWVQGSSPWRCTKKVIWFFLSPCGSLQSAYRAYWFFPVRSRVARYRLRRLGSACSRSADFASSKQVLTVFPCSPSGGAKKSRSNDLLFLFNPKDWHVINALARCMESRFKTLRSK